MTNKDETTQDVQTTQAAQNTGGSFMDELNQLDTGGSFGAMPVDDYAFTIEKYDVKQSDKTGEYYADLWLGVTQNPDGYDGRKVFYYCGLEGETAKGGTKAFGVIKVMKEVLRHQPDAEETLGIAWGNLYKDGNGNIGIERDEEGNANLDAWTELLDMLVGMYVEGHVKHEKKRAYSNGQLQETDEVRERLAYFLYEKN